MEAYKTADGAKRILHFLVCVVVAILWGIGNAFYTFAFLFIRLMDKIEPDSEYGNCWTFGAAKWMRHGGYLMCRPADGQRFMKFLPVPHVIWVKRLDRKTVLEQFVPLERKAGRWIPWHTVYYRGELRKVESPHNARTEK